MGTLHALGRWLPIALLLVACSRTPPPKRPSETVRADLDRAEAAEKARKHDEARRYYERAIARATEPVSSGLAHHKFAETLATWGETAEARTHYEAAVAAQPADPIAWQGLGIVRHKLGDIAGAIAALERSKQLAPRAWVPRRDLAVLHWSRSEGRNADPDPEIAARHRAAALAEYRAMLELELPTRLREKVKWAVEQLSRPPSTKHAPFRVPDAKPPGPGPSPGTTDPSPAGASPGPPPAPASSPTS